MSREEETVPVTVCPPGRRSKSIAERAPIIGGPPISTSTALQWPQKPSLVPPAKGDRRPAHERVEAALRADAMSVVLAQPHRAGSDDARLSFALGRFCARFWSKSPEFANSMHAAGVAYASAIRAVKVARGFHVGGCASDNAGGEKPIEDLSKEGIEAAQAKVYGLERTLARADDLLRDVMPRCPAAMVRLCFDHQDPSPYDESMLKSGLYRLALHFGKWEQKWR
jgi:hypothetical protein